MASLLDFLQVNKQKTFRPKKRFPQGTMRYNLHKKAEATLHSGVDLRTAVRLPANENLDDWIAVHTVDFFNRINLMYGTVADACTKESCPTMSGGAKYEYLWQDGTDYKKPTRLPAPDYMVLLMDWIELRINDESIFPSSTYVPFPRDFRQICKKILTRLFRVFVHVYIHHFDRLVSIGAEPHVNTLYKHFYFFVTEYNMVSSKELEALTVLILRPLLRFDHFVPIICLPLTERALSLLMRRNLFHEMEEFERRVENWPNVGSKTKEMTERLLESSQNRRIRTIAQLAG